MACSTQRCWLYCGYLGASIATGVGRSSVHRADFLDALVTQLPEGIAQFSKRATQVEQQGDEVRVLFTEGTDYRCDLLIGADGIKSALRSHVLEGLGVAPQAPRFTGTRACAKPIGPTASTSTWWTCRRCTWGSTAISSPSR
ncbi:FAD-dependent oxidoreductase [Stutzerimonas stutzeri]|uniref:FAD-dependent oxidoreductase n=1 Tax=Pseudomonadaceae TaxID=135621 RepID=UPI00142D6ADA|nr:hypothetical protein [Stutzerimonas stutzeri]